MTETCGNLIGEIRIPIPTGFVIYPIRCNRNSPHHPSENCVYTDKAEPHLVIVRHSDKR